MDRAINKSTGEVVSAFEVFQNGSYQNLTKGEWISPQDSIYNWEEIEEEDSYVHYVGEKRYTNWNGTQVYCSPHFSKYKGSKAKTVQESPEHKMLKNWLFTRLKNDDLNIIYSTATKKYKYNNSNKLSELDIDWKNYSIEVPIRSMKNLKADILLPFKRKNNLLGYGIVIEVQLSKQNEEETYNRSIDRAINGYSTIWLFKKDFMINDNEIELKNNDLKVFSFAAELKYSGKKFMRNLKLSVEEQCRFLDIKKQELQEKTEEVENYKEEIIEDIKKSTNGFFGYKIKELSENFNEEIAKKVESNFFDNNKDKIINLIEEALYRHVNSETLSKSINRIDIDKITEEARYLIHDKIKNYNLYKELISNPPKCNGCGISLILDNGQYGLWWKCRSYPQCRAKNSHSIPDEIKNLFKRDDKNKIY